MVVLTNQSTCRDCKGLQVCQKVKRLNPASTISDELRDMWCKASKGELDENVMLCKIDSSTYRERPIDVFDIIIVNCSMKKRYDGK